MKKFLLSAVIILSILISYGQKFHELSFKNIDGDEISLKKYAGKKLLFFIAPLSKSDSFFTQLQNFKNQYSDTVQIIGILSFEDGYEPAKSASVKALYNKMGIVLTEGMYTKKTSGKNQSALMQWLTDRTKNTHFDMDSWGIGHKFFVNSKGRLYAVMPPQTSLQHPIIQNIVHSKDQ